MLINIINTCRSTAAVYSISMSWIDIALVDKVASTVDQTLEKMKYYFTMNIKCVTKGMFEKSVYTVHCRFFQPKNGTLLN